MFDKSGWMRRAPAMLGLIAAAAIVISASQAKAGLIEDGLSPSSPSSDVDQAATALNGQDGSVTPTTDASAESTPAGTPGLPLSGRVAPQQMLLASATGSFGGTGLGGGVEHRALRRRRTSGMSPGSGMGSGGGSGGSSSGAGSSGQGAAANTGSTSGSGISSGGSSGTASDASSANSSSSPTAFASTPSSFSTADLSGTASSNNVGAGAIMPTSINGGTYLFTGTSAAGAGGTSAPLTFDPPLAPGFNFATAPGSPNFASIQVVNPLPNTSNLFVTFDGQTDSFTPGSVFNFQQYVPNGVSSFTLTGISPLDVQASGGSEFLANITFTQTGQFAFTETALTSPNRFDGVAPSVPEPGSLVLLAVGAVALLGWHRQRGPGKTD